MLSPSLFLLLLAALFGGNAQPTAYVNPTAASMQRTLPQCQCIPDSTGTGCLKYDSRFQAATLEEAMASFPDLTLEHNDTKTLEVPAASTTDARCVSEQCRDCQEELKHKLKQIGLMPLAINEALAAQASTNSTCYKYRFSRKDEGVYDHEHDEEDDSSSSEEDDEEAKKEEKKQKKKTNKKTKKEDRKKRQAAGVNVTDIIGQRFTLSCSAKGVTTDVTGMVSLCSSCWVWRKLPDNYVPQYINELVCDDKDGACLSGYATCGVGHRAIEVLRHDGGTPITVALTAGSYCECRIASGSALQSLVNGAGLTSPLPLPPKNGTSGK